VQPQIQAQTPPVTATAPVRVIVYIDGFNLYFGMREKGWRRYYWLDVRRLALNLLRSNQKLVAVRYFTSRVRSTPSNPLQHKRQNTYLEALETVPDTTIEFGHYLTRWTQCHQCGATWISSEEKMTDVNIAMSLLVDAQQDLFDTALLVSADSDLTGPVLKVRRLFPDKRVVIAFPPARSSARLLQEANAAFTISRKTLHDSQLPDQITKRDGFVLRRPAEWR
jgi:uncharacterized LabA/DUF88 family protein